MNSDEKAPIGVIEIDIPSRTDLVTVVRLIVDAAARAAGSLDGDRLDDLSWVTSEAVTNAIQANQRVATPGRVRAQCEVGPGWVSLVVADQGPGMDELDELPDMEHPDRLQLEGGFGVPLMKRLSSGEVVFHSTPEGTTVELEIRQ